MAFQLLKTFAALAGILGLIFGLAWTLKKFNLTPAQGDGGTAGWRLLGIRMLGPRRQLYVMEIGSRILVIGTTDKTMTPLMEIADPAEREIVIEALAKKKKMPLSFQDLLKKAENR